MEPPKPRKRWSVAAGNSSAEALLCQELKVSAVAARLLVNRGLCDPAEAFEFLNPTLDRFHDPLDLPDCDKAVRRIAKAIEAKETVFVHGDYDVDGLTSCALWTRMLRKLGVNVVPFVPHRHKNGYGVHREAVEAAKAAGATLLITCDCGIGAHEVVEYARDLRIEVIVTDHHEPKETLPDALAVVNPKRADCRYPFRDLSGAGVSFKVGEALVRELGYPTTNFRKHFMDLAALGTVADVMPLLGENRVLVANALPSLHRTGKVGLKTLFKKVGLPGKSKRGITTGDISWMIAPRLNAVGRVDDAALGLKLLLCECEEEATDITEMLEQLNEARKQEQYAVTREAEKMVLEQDLARVKLLLVVGQNWNGGVVGLVAGSLKERFHRPTLVASFTDGSDIARGSGRSIGRFNMCDALRHCEHLFESCGGHAMAAGFSLTRENLPLIRQALEAYAEAEITDDLLLPEVVADMEIDPADATFGLLEELSAFEPFGQGNEQPMFMARGVQLSHKVITRGGNHVQAKFRSAAGEVRAIGFRMVEAFETCEVGDDVDVLFELDRDDWMGSNSVQWKIRDVRPAGWVAPAEPAPRIETAQEVAVIDLR